MSEYCHDCGATIHEDDISLCPKCANRREVPMTDLIERAEEYVADSLMSPSGREIIRDLLAVVSKLPLTADGVPVVPGIGDLVYLYRSPFGVVGATAEWGLFPVSWPDGDYSARISECYSTRTAAEQARKAGE